MTTLVTGGTGLVGSAVIERLEAEGEPAVCFDLDDGDVPGEETPSVVGDVTRSDDLQAVIDDHRPDRIVHLAALVGGGLTDSQPSRALRVNVTGTDTVLRAAAEADLGRVVLASTLGVYGPADHYPTDAVSETTVVPAALNDYRGYSFYRATKQLNEFQARLYADRAGIDTRVIRPSVVFGPRRDRQWLGRVIDDALHAGSGVIERPPDAELSIVYMTDVAALFVAVALAEAPDHRVYNSGGNTVTARGFARIIERATGGTVTCDEQAPPKAAPPVVENRRAVEEFGYGLTPLEDAVRDYVARIS